MATRYKTKSEVFLDSNGHARAGGLVNFYITGTTTRQNTYTDDGLTTPNANPVVLDGSGRSATDIFLLSAEYKSVLTNSDATDAITDDPVHGAGSLPWSAAGGTANAITVGAVSALADGLIVAFRATAVNTSTTPTFAPTGQTAHTITKAGGKALELGDIAGNLAEYFVRYNLANTRWELLNPSQRLRNAYINFTGSSPVGTSSATKVMMGLGSSWALTPTTTGRIRISVTGYSTNSLLGNAKLNIYFGTGAAPANAAALTGSFFASTDLLATSANSGASPAVPFTLVMESGGFSLALAYWFDIALGSSSGTSSAIVNFVIIEEL